MSNVGTLNKASLYNIFFLIMRRQADKFISQEIDKSYRTICVTINENISSVNGINDILHNIFNGCSTIIIPNLTKSCKLRDILFQCIM